MDPEVFFALLFAGGVGCFTGFMWGKARAAKQFLERWGDALLMRGRAPEAAAVPSADAVRRITSSVDHLAERFELMEQRLDFAERLLERERLPSTTRPDLPR
jgi:hypothetical protein